MKNEFLDAGQIVSTHGIRGEIKILPWADGPDFLLDFDTVYIDGKAYRVAAARVQKTCVLMKLDGVDDVEHAALLREKTVQIRHGDAKLAEGAVFVADLIGLPVYADEEKIGEVADILTYPGSDVYVIRGEHEYMIPAVPAFILERNLDKGYVRVKLIEGMRTDEI